jgi:hypothetical protein
MNNIIKPIIEESYDDYLYRLYPENIEFDKNSFNITF